MDEFESIETKHANQRRDLMVTSGGVYFVDLVRAAYFTNLKPERYTTNQSTPLLCPVKQRKSKAKSLLRVKVVCVLFGVRRKLTCPLKVRNKVVYKEEWGGASS